MGFIVKKIDYKMYWDEGTASNFTMYMTRNEYEEDPEIHKGESEGYIKSKKYDEGLWVLVEFCTEKNKYRIVDEQYCVAFGVRDILEKLLCDY